MAHFYGSVIGQSGREEHRLGSKRTGITVYAASYAGGLKLRLWHDPETGKDHWSLDHVTHEGAGLSAAIATGIVGEE